jgi:hypothetical protein
VKFDQAYIIFKLLPSINSASTGILRPWIFTTDRSYLHLLFFVTTCTLIQATTTTDIYCYNNFPFCQSMIYDTMYATTKYQYSRYHHVGILPYTAISSPQSEWPW